MLAAFLPLTIFYFIILFFKVNIVSSSLYGFVYYSQATAMPALARIILLLARDTPSIVIPARFIGILYGLIFFVL